MKTIDEMLAWLWNDYVSLNPRAARLHDELLKLGGRVNNDHIAFRTFDLAPVRMETLAWHFMRQGYVFGAQYDIVDKRAPGS